MVLLLSTFLSFGGAFHPKDPYPFKHERLVASRPPIWAPVMVPHLTLGPDDPFGVSVWTSSRRFNDDAELRFGTGTDYWWVYDSANTQFELDSTDCDAVGGNCVVALVNDGTDDFELVAGDLILDATAQRLIFAVDNDAATPSITLEAGSGFYASANNVVGVAVNGGVWGNFSGNGVLSMGTSSECTLSRGILFCTSQSAIVRLHQQQNGMASEVMSSADATTEVGARLGTAVADGSLTGAATLRLASYCTDCDGTPVEKGYVNANGDSVMDGMYAQDSVSTLTLNAATTIAVTKNVHILDCDGAETLTTITGGLAGAFLTFKFLDADVCTITDDDTGTANTIDISAAYLSTARDTLTLFFDGTSWVEVSRAVN